MKHWTDGMARWQKNAVVYTSPVFYLGLALWCVGFVFTLMFFFLTNSRTLR